MNRGTLPDGGADWKRVHRRMGNDGAVPGKKAAPDLPEDVRMRLAVSVADESIGAAQGTLVA
ncbi:hypothetical protein [Nocardiopsis coralliicola]